MRLLLDNNLSPRLGDVLVKEGWDVAHVASLGFDLRATGPFSRQPVRTAEY